MAEMPRLRFQVKDKEDKTKIETKGANNLKKDPTFQYNHSLLQLNLASLKVKRRDLILQNLKEELGLILKLIKVILKL